jgi:hypothetical protein
MGSRGSKVHGFGSRVQRFASRDHDYTGGDRLVDKRQT